MLTNTILILNGKGGVGKTSLTANLAGLAARSGWPTLAVDLDRQGNLQRDLGYASDGGRSLVAAALGRGSVEVIREVRPGLDVIAGGRVLDELVAQMQVGLMNSKVSVLKAIEKALEPATTTWSCWTVGQENRRSRPERYEQATLSSSRPGPTTPPWTGSTLSPRY